MELVEDEFFCGFTREQLVSPQGAKKLVRHTHFLYILLANMILYRYKMHVTVTVALFLVSIERGWNDACPRRFGRLKDALQRSIAGFYAKLWDIRDSFLIGNFQGRYRIKTPPKADLNLFHDTLLDLSLRALEELDENRYVSIAHSDCPQLTWLC